MFLLGDKASQWILLDKSFFYLAIAGVVAGHYYLFHVEMGSFP